MWQNRVHDRKNRLYDPPIFLYSRKENSCFHIAKKERIREMRRETLLTEALFTKASTPTESDWIEVALPHTWNNLDGQDGGGNYHQGECRYRISLPAPTTGKRQFIQFDGANHVAKVWCNGDYLGEHRGGFSTFRFELTDHLRAEANELTVSVDNRVGNHVYPQQADFTFFGGLYRSVTLVEVPAAHFDLMKAGSQGVFVTPTVDNGGATLRIDAFPVGMGAAEVRCRILDGAGVCVAEASAPAADQTVLNLTLESPHLWNGIKDAYLYTAELTLADGGQDTDRVTVSFGIRTYRVDANQGFFLNGVSCPLRGVSRHQDRLDKGWALDRADHEEDLALIREVGANTIRLAHYQHAPYFYDLCDRAGMVLWAEIPFISVFDKSPEARENTLSQMRELIAQNYNRPSICFWGISNEITISGDSPALLENLKELAALVKELDPSRLSTIAQLSMVPLDSPHNQLTDILAYNHYFGWYGGNVDMNAPWFDQFHTVHPDRPLGLSEYGAECVMGWHSATPKVKDYTEEYQAYYHEEMLKAFSTRPFLWGTYVWNMFDFAADARDEGGSQGRNNKGLVTYDRKLKKDSFYAYKSWWSDEPFVHVGGRRFVNRDGGKTWIKVYSNQSTITLTVNGELVGTSEEGHVFRFDEVALRLGENTVTATTPGGLSDTITLVGVSEPDPSYLLPQEDDSEAVRNWFEELAAGADGVQELRFPEGYYSVQDSLGDLLGNPVTGKMIMDMMTAAMGKSMMKMAENMVDGDGRMGMLQGMSIDLLLQFAGDKFPPETKVLINEQLIKVKKN